MPSTIDELKKGFELGPWTVNPERDLLSKGSIEEHLEPMVMDVLVVLASAQGQVVTKDQLVDAIWHGRPTTDETIATKIAVLRNKLGTTLATRNISRPSVREAIASGSSSLFEATTYWRIAPTPPAEKFSLGSPLQ